MAKIAQGIKIKSCKNFWNILCVCVWGGGILLKLSDNCFRPMKGRHHASVGVTRRTLAHVLLVLQIDASTTLVDDAFDAYKTHNARSRVARKSRIYM